MNTETDFTPAELTWINEVIDEADKEARRRYIQEHIRPRFIHAACLAVP